MVKQLIHAYIDPDTYLHLKVRGGSISAIVNSLLKEFVGNNIQTPDEKELLTELDDEKRKIEESQRKIEILAAHITAAREQTKIDRKKLEAAQHAAHHLSQEETRAWR